nr:hypothetical protein [uncultured bacterium]
MLGCVRILGKVWGTDALAVIFAKVTGILAACAASKRKVAQNL